MRAAVDHHHPQDVADHVGWRAECDHVVAVLAVEFHAAGHAVAGQRQHVGPVPGVDLREAAEGVGVAAVDARVGDVDRVGPARRVDHHVAVDARVGDVDVVRHVLRGDRGVHRSSRVGHVDHGHAHRRR